MASSLELLTTDEVFLEPSTIGELLPKGRQRYLEWAQLRNKEIEKNQRHANSTNNIENYDSDDDKEDGDENDNEVNSQTQNSGMHEIIDVDTVDSNDDATTEFVKRSRNRTRTNKMRRVLVYNLRTVEMFPSKYLVDSDDNDNDEIENENEGTPSTVSATVVPEANGGHNNSKTKTTGRVKTKNRKRSGLFQRLPLDAQIVRSIPPPNASGIVGVMGRSVDLHQFIDTTNNANVNDDEDHDHDHGDAGLYSMLRAWVRDDPENTVRSAATTDTTAAAAAAGNVRRKTLLEYSKKDEPASTKAIAKTAQQQQQPPKLLNLEPPPDMLGWLATDPLFRSSTPGYPTQKEIRENLQKSRSKKEAKARRKRRLNSARESLRRRGIHV